MIGWNTFSARVGIGFEEARTAELWTEWAAKYHRPIRFRTHRRWRETVRAVGHLDVSTRSAKSLLAVGWTAPWSAHGFVRGCSTVSAASPHSGAKVVLSVDLKDFFGQVTYTRVAPTLELNFDKDVLRWVEGCCFVGGSLPLGLRTSPLLSNIAFRRTDTRIEQLVRDRDIQYSRWVDDLSFSGDGVNDQFYSEVATVISEEGWTLNGSKTRFMRKSPYVLGLYVGSDTAFPHRPHLPRWMKRKLLVETFYYSKYGAPHFQRDGVWPVGKLYGLVSYAGVVDPTFAEKLAKRLSQGERAGSA